MFADRGYPGRHGARCRAAGGADSRRRAGAGAGALWIWYGREVKALLACGRLSRRKRTVCIHGDGEYALAFARRLPRPHVQCA
ncbi:hypothetical protein KCP70_19930 [Salmonella enterica subsp. enterica]|nr:hypothetical protein KCP70_19930 [Salmonella enterica subsp. enterica]